MVSANINVNVNVNVMQLYPRRISMANVNMNVMQVYTQRISMANVNMNIMQLYIRVSKSVLSQPVDAIFSISQASGQVCRPFFCHVSSELSVC